MSRDKLIPLHGGYRKLKSFQVAQLVYDVTVRFCDRYIERRSRTARPDGAGGALGVQNIAEGSQASGTSKKTELKLTNVARASLEELRLDYEDFLRQRGMRQWPPDHPALMRFKAKRCATMEELRAWAEEDEGGEDGHGQPDRNTEDARAGGRWLSVKVQCQHVSSAQLVANAALSLLNLCCYFLDRQLAALDEASWRKAVSRSGSTRCGAKGGAVAKFTESMVEDAALSWLGELEFAVMHGPRSRRVSWRRSGPVLARRYWRNGCGRRCES